MTRAIQFLQYFESRNDRISVDFVTEEHNDIDQEKEKMEKLFPGIRTFFLKRKREKKNYIKYFFNAKIPFLLDKQKQKKYHKHIPSQVSLFAKQQFNDILQNTQYDVIIISYVFWTSLIRNNPYTKGAKLVIDTHDLMTGQYKNKKGFQLGATFEEEIKILNEFHESWSLSIDELYMFSQFAPQTSHLFVPVMFSKNIPQKKHEKVYDIIYVASDNSSNQLSAKWFFDTVYPLLSNDIKICVVGGVVDTVPDLPNVKKVFFAENLEPYYHQSKVSICPMLQGTGIKVKVVEALSFGLPVVCTLRGLDGLPLKKYNGCLMAEDEKMFASHIHNLLTDPRLYSQVQQNGFKMIEDHFEITEGYQHLDKIFNIV